MLFLILLILACDDGPPESPGAAAPGPVSVPGLYRMQLGASSSEVCGKLSATEGSALLESPAHGGLFEVAWFFHGWGRLELQCSGPQADGGFTCPEAVDSVTWESWGIPLTVTQVISAQGSWDATGTLEATLNSAWTCSGSACSSSFPWAGDDGGSCSQQRSFDLDLTVASQGQSCTSGTYATLPTDPGWVLTAIRPTARPTTLTRVAVQLRHDPSCTDSVDVRVFAAPEGDAPASFPNDCAVGSTGSLVYDSGAEWSVAALDRAVEVGEEDLVWVAVALELGDGLGSCPLRCQSSTISAWDTASTEGSFDWSGADPVAVMLGEDGGS